MGALAVALGIGAGVLGGVLPAASASPEDSSQTADAADSTAQSPRGRSHRSGPQARTRATAPDTADRGSRLSEPVSPVSSTPRKNSAPPALSAPAPAPAVQADAAELSLVHAKAAAKIAAPSSAVAPAAAAAVPTPAPAVTVTAPVAAAPAAVHAPPAATAGGLDSILAPLFGSGPGAPVQSPVGWVMLAAARRQTGRTSAAPAPGVSTGQLVRSAATNGIPVISSAVAAAPNAATGAVTITVKATDPNADPLSYKGTATKGTVTATTAGVLTYTPTATARHAAAKTGATTATKSDTVTVTVTDSKGAAVTKAVTVTVAPKNAVPTSVTSALTTNATTGAVTGTVTGTDADRDTLSYTGAATTKGTVSVNATTGAFTYTPTAAARHAAAKIGALATDKTDTFTMTITDGYGANVAVPVKVTISPINAKPVAAKATIATRELTAGTVTGTATASDANKDVLTYSAPATTAKGTVIVNAKTGAFTYTPTATARSVAVGATGTTDAFTVTAIDGYGGTVSIPVTVPVIAKPVTGGLKFTFNYTSGSQYWTPESKAALQTAANNVASYIVVFAPTTVTFDFAAENNPGSLTLASAGSDFVTGGAGFMDTVVQRKILTGLDANRTTADGDVTVNLGMNWGFGSTVNQWNQYDFVSTAMHELLHTVGFLSYVDEAGYNNSYRFGTYDGLQWTKFDSFMTNKSRVKVIGT
ncbi:MAG: Ig-like domain-containing protein, partial [Mycobacterium sp.]